MKFLIALCLVIALPPAYGQSGKKASAKSIDQTPPKAHDDIVDILNSIGYPELQVVPRASERLLMEAKEERGSWFVTHWPIELSGLTTLYVGLTAKSHQRAGLTDRETRDANTFSSITTAIGAGWLVGGLVLGLQQPYRSGIHDVARNQGKGQNADLMRERLAEEALEKPAKVMRVLQYVAVLSNLTGNVLAGVYSDSNGAVIAGVGALMSFLPMAFEDHNIEVYDKQIEYKKKIFTPIKSAYFQYEPQSRTFTPMTGLVWEF